jgi:mannose-1-phosphate guanylyltransferase/mannose-6-phosphate isomerase
VIVLIIAGGSGTRLWPLSVSDYPKHLLKITNNKSLLQNTFERVKLITSVDKIYISTEQSHSDHVIEQLPELSKENIIIEPARRSTMPCITNALQIIAKLHGSEEPIASIWADQHIRATKAFAETFKYAADVSTKYKRIALVGIEPDEPSVKFGYIKKNGQIENEPFLHSVEAFKEKPDFETAKQYVESGDYLWNAGYFVAPYSVFKDRIEKFADEHWTVQLDRLATTKSHEEANQIYLEYKDEAIDTALIEKVPDLMVIPGNFDWMDVGSFDDVHQVSPKDEDGNACFGSNIYALESEQMYIRNEEEKPVAVVGLDNITVVNTKHGVLVMRTDRSQKVKEIVNKLKEQDA